MIGPAYIGALAGRPQFVSGGSDVVLPADLEALLVLWLDAQDNSTIGIDSGKVATWADKSGNGFHCSQSLVDNRAIVAAEAIGVRQALYFSNAYMVGDAATGADLFGDATNFTIAFVIKTDNDAAPRTLISSRGAFSRVTFHPGYAGDTSYFDAGDEGAARVSGTRSWVAGGAGVLTRNGADVSARGDGTVFASRANASGTADLTSEYSIAAFNPLGSDKMNGYVGEIMVYPALGSTDTQRIEGYLAHRWGLEGNLPGGHPYKLSPP